jgi:hypothetical protein
LAWLRSAPKSTANEKVTKSRIEKLADGHPAKRLPDANEYLSEAFTLTGCFSRVEMGIIPLSWQEIGAFAKTSGYALDSWESEIIYKMSVEYCNIHSRATASKSFPAPYRLGKCKKETAERIEANFDAFFA